MQITRIFCEASLLRPFFPVFISCNEPCATNKHAPSAAVLNVGKDAVKNANNNRKLDNNIAAGLCCDTAAADPTHMPSNNNSSSCTHEHNSTSGALYESHTSSAHTADWCKRCDKCAFMFLLLSAWLPPDVVVNTIFNKVNMLEDVTLLPVFLQLIGQGSVNTGKPFDCVGTVLEASAAVHLAAVRYLCSGYGYGSPEEEYEEQHVHLLPNINPSSPVLPPQLQVLHASSTLPTLPVVLSELCKSLQIEWDDSMHCPSVTNTSDILALWGLS